MSDLCECGHYSRHHNIGKRGSCGHCSCRGFSPAEAPDLRGAVLRLAGSVTAASDQAEAMTDAELGALLLAGRWSTIEVHEAGRRLTASPAPAEPPREEVSEPGFPTTRMPASSEGTHRGMRGSEAAPEPGSLTSPAPAEPPERKET